MICPIDDLSCPYFNREVWGCMMGIEEDCDPKEECDAWFEVETREYDED